MKFDDTPSREEREDFWLDLGPASAYEGLDCCEPVPHLPPQLKALEWLDTMGSPDDVPPIDR